MSAKRWLSHALHDLIVLEALPHARAQARDVDCQIYRCARNMDAAGEAANEFIWSKVRACDPRLTGHLDDREAISFITQVCFVAYRIRDILLTETRHSVVSRQFLHGHP